MASGGTPAANNWAPLDTTIGTPDSSGSKTRRLHTCRMNPAFHADAASCVGDGVRVRPPIIPNFHLRQVRSLLKWFCNFIRRKRRFFRFNQNNH
jgi:hypothetical protein